MELSFWVVLMHYPFFEIWGAVVSDRKDMVLFEMEESNMHFLHVPNSGKPVAYYSLMI